MSRTICRGVPTDIDVRRMHDAFGIPETGRVITYTEVERVLGVGRKSSRFQSVTLAWRKMLAREHRILIECDRGRGFMSVDDSAKIGAGYGAMKSGVRRFKKSLNLVGLANRENLTPVDQIRSDHAQIVNTSVLTLVQQETKRFKGQFLAQASPPSLTDSRSGCIPASDQKGVN